MMRPRIYSLARRSKHAILTATFSKTNAIDGRRRHCTLAKLPHVFLGSGVLILPCKPATFCTVYEALWKFSIPSGLTIFKAPHLVFSMLSNQETFASHIRDENHEEFGKYKKAGDYEEDCALEHSAVHSGEAKRSRSRQYQVKEGLISASQHTMLKSLDRSEYLLWMFTLLVLTVLYTKCRRT